MLRQYLLKHKSIRVLYRNLSVAQPTNNEEHRVKAWQVHSFGDELQLCSIRQPHISKPSDVLVKVEAASVNPIDLAMQNGYGRTIVKLFQCQEMILPLTLGRDFSGVICDKGHDVGDDYQIGDKVYGVVPIHKQGSHAETVIVDKGHIVKKPDNLTHTEAAAIPYAALTAYSALWFTGALCFRRHKGLKVLILGASGGVGVCAVQMLRAAEVTVMGTCSTDAVPLVQSLGADAVFDYTDPNYDQNVASQGRYDIILDCAKIGHKCIPSSWQYLSYISLNSPLLRNTDEHGLIGGLLYSAGDLIPANIASIPQGKCVQWAFFYPSTDGLYFMDNLIRTGKLNPLVQQVYKFTETPCAYQRATEGHLRGKIVIDMLP